MEDTVQSPNKTTRDGRTRSVRLCASERREMLIDAAILTFSEKGYYATTMEEVAVAAGVTKPVIYQHFDSKRDLYEAILKRVKSDLVAALNTSNTTSNSKKERFESGFEAYFKFVYENRPAFEIMFSSSPRKDPGFREIVDSIDSHVASSISMEIDASLDETHRHLIATGVIALAEGIARRYLREHSPELDANGNLVSFKESLALLWAKRMSALIWNGLESYQRKL